MPGRCPIIGSLPRAGRIFAGKLSAGGDFSRERSYNVETLWGRRYFNKRETYQFRDYLSSGGFFMGRHVNVTPANPSTSIAVKLPRMHLSVHGRDDGRAAIGLLCDRRLALRRCNTCLSQRCRHPRARTQRRCRKKNCDDGPDRSKVG